MMTDENATSINKAHTLPDIINRHFIF